MNANNGERRILLGATSILVTIVSALLYYMWTETQEGVKARARYIPILEEMRVKIIDLDHRVNVIERNNRPNH